MLSANPSVAQDSFPRWTRVKPDPPPGPPCVTSASPSSSSSARRPQGAGASVERPHPRPPGPRHRAGAGEEPLSTKGPALLGPPSARLRRTSPRSSRSRARTSSDGRRPGGSAPTSCRPVLEMPWLRCPRRPPGLARVGQMVLAMHPPAGPGRLQVPEWRRAGHHSQQPSSSIPAARSPSMSQEAAQWCSTCSPCDCWFHQASA
mmetsp:Transcript_13816/g.39550  ORF Transcript_13816/g.39550 Transcript_13816/m.39550 type:complete len:204 (+) Transcript_13816:178-789(+)